MGTFPKTYYRTCKTLFIVFIVAMTIHGYANNKKVPVITELNAYTNKTVKKLRNDIRTTLYTIKSGRPSNQLPQLTFYTYKVKKDDNFWQILSRASLDIDTLMTVNDLSSPKDLYPGRLLYIPNMRGIVLKASKTSLIKKILLREKIKPVYVTTINKISHITGHSKDYIFIPCGKITNIERSLFLGTGFMFPLDAGRRTSGFGTRRNPFNHRTFEFHSGIDLACRRNSKVYAARDGVVTYTGYKGGYGKLVILKHEYGYHSMYGHLNKWVVKPGQKVHRGQLIAYSGNTGRTTGPHLHFEVRKGKKAINPGVLLHK